MTPSGPQSLVLSVISKDGLHVEDIKFCLALTVVPRTANPQNGSHWCR